METPVPPEPAKKGRRRKPDDLKASKWSADLYPWERKAFDELLDKTRAKRLKP